MLRPRALSVLAGCLVPWAALLACGSRTELFVLEPPPSAAEDSSPPDVGTPDAALSEDTSSAPDADASIDVNPDMAVPPIDGALPDAAPLCPDGGTSEAYLWAASGVLYSFDPPTLSFSPLGVVSCPTAAQPWTFSVSRDGYGYMIFEDWNIYRVDLATLACETTPYQPFQLGFTGSEAIAVSRGPSAERLFVYGVTPTPTLAVTDLTSFVLSPVGAVTPDPNVFPLDMQGDAFGRLFALSEGGILLQIDSATATLIGQDQTSYSSQSGGWAIMAYNEQLFFFGGTEGSIYSYDLMTKQVTPVGQVNDTIVGASAAACIH